MSLRFLTGGESHGKALIGIIEGIPSGLPLLPDDINKELKRRQGGKGRGGRMKIEDDRAEILSGVRLGKTLGSPLSLLIENKDWINWKEVMSSEAILNVIEPVTKPRPGHADLAGAMKYNTHDIRDILERSSARETAMRVALGAVAKRLLEEFDILIGSYVISIGSVKCKETEPKFWAEPRYLISIAEKAEKSPVRCPFKNDSKEMEKLIEKAQKEGNSLGGVFEVFAVGVPPGLGSHIQWDRRLDGRLAQALMSIQAIKAVAVGSGFNMASRFGRDVMDEIFYRSGRFLRKTNNAGGIEGGMTNGMPIVLRAAMKPIPTQRKPLRTVDIKTKKPVSAVYERSDICAVPSASVIGEAMTALTLSDAFLEKFGGDSIKETKRNYNSYIGYLKGF